MNKETEELLFEAWNWCDGEDKSTEFMLAYMSDCSGLDYDGVVDWIVTDEASEARKKYNEAKNK